MNGPVMASMKVKTRYTGDSAEQTDAMIALCESLRERYPQRGFKSEHCRAQMYSLSTQYLKMWCLVTAERIAKESKAARISAKVHAKAARIAELVESARIVQEYEATRIAAKVEEARITARIATVLSRRHESASTRRPVEQSYKCKEAERQRSIFGCV